MDPTFKCFLILPLLLAAGCSVEPAVSSPQPEAAVAIVADSPTVEQSESAVAKSPPASHDAVIPANNLVRLKTQVGETVTVVGRVNDVRKTGSGRRFLNFAGGLAATCDGAAYRAFEMKKPLEAFAGKDVQLTGRLKLFKGKLQVELTTPENIRLAVSKPKPRAGRATPSVVLKQLGKDRWMSPAGLMYVGRDPQGKTRVEHILRHAQDMPSRAGPHGVFDKGEQAEVFALIDDAWRLAEQKKLRPKVEGSRSIYTVTFPTRIGYLGGQTGKRKRNPPLKQLLIVFESGTKNIVTAYPK